ncbi:acyltransferase family protein [Pseudomonas sp. MWU13-2105]|uniref:acyltransferase family protein n=1 Tax=Pseudomonas sp. MWU13-2105 TaxID=2935074 RepID=UPI0020109D1C|nr:acyltransferase family protein [Pseudomonas sp. MWU13-2105]
MTSLKLEQPPGKTASHSPIAYRQDIDGLRAIAVIAVMITHAFPSLLGGGFIGVDIFFVISGFLISSILFRNLQSDTFSLGHFYAWRIIRIFPALIAVLVFCLAFGWLALLADEYSLLGKHTLAGSAFISNLILWSETSYFDVAAEAKPLLHLWSLGIEEQFYLAWPLILLLLWRSRASPGLAIAALATLSFALNIHQATHNSTADFYSPLSRLWELLVGAMLACATGKWKPTTSISNSLSLAGTLLITSGLATITRSSVFPGTLALLPVIGATLLIAAGPQGLINRTILSNRLLVGIGLISYPLYLWHWPLLSFTRIIESATPSLESRIALLILAFALAWATYRFIERPIRLGRFNNPMTAKLLVATMILVALTALTIQANNGFPSRTGANPVSIYPDDLGRDPYIAYLNKHFSRCSDEKLKSFSAYDPGANGYRCFQSKPSGPVDMLLIGDSHAEHLLPGLSEQFKDLNVASFIHVDIPVIDSEKFKDAFEIVLADKSIKTVIISAAWEGKIVPSLDNLPSRLKNTFDAFKHSGKKLYVLDDIPSFLFDSAKCKYGRRFSGSGQTCSSELAEHLNRRKYYYDTLQSAVTASGYPTLIQTYKYFCTEKSCGMTRDGSLLYRDSNHLTISGSEYLARRLLQDKAL